MVRIHLAFSVVLLVGLLAVLAVFIPSAMPIFQAIFPVLALVVAYYFPKR